jgi:glycosyltransferase involved in cell wall biosynthesis
MPPPSPAITVVVPVRDGAAYLGRALESVRRQTFADWELVAVDDGSVDTTPRLLYEWALVDHRVRALRHRVNAGVSAARNTALRAARGEWVAYLDSDDEFYPDHLARVWAERGRGDALVFEYDIRDPRRPGGAGPPEYRFRAGPWPPRPSDAPMPVPLGVAHRRAVLDRVGLFDEALAREEDRDLWVRLARAGAAIAFVPAASGRYHVRSESLSRTAGPAAPRAGPPPPPEVEVLHDRAGRQPDPPAGRRVPRTGCGPARVLFCSYHGYLDPASGAAWAVRDLLESFAARGRACGVLCGPDLDAGRPVPLAAALRRAGFGFSAERARPAGLEADLLHGVVDGVPVTVFDPVGRLAAPEPTPAEEAAFLEVLRQVQGHFRADVLLTYGGHRLARAAMAEGRRLGMAVAVWVHNLAYRDPGFFRAADAVLVPSTFAQDHYGRLGVACTALPGPVRADRVRCDRRDPRYLTFVNPIPNKGVTLAARVFAELGRRRPDIPALVVAGRGDVDGLARSGVDLSNVDTVHRMPNRADPRDFLRMTRVLLVPSVHAETFGRVAAEAVLNGIPVVASDHEALPDTVGPAGTLLPVPASVKEDPTVTPTAEEAAPWVEAVVRAWDAAGPAVPPDVRAEVCTRWSGEAAVGRFAEWFDGLVGRTDGAGRAGAGGAS